MKPSESPPQPANRSMKRTCPLLFLPAIQVRFICLSSIAYFNSRIPAILSEIDTRQNGQASSYANATEDGVAAERKERFKRMVMGQVSDGYPCRGPITIPTSDPWLSLARTLGYGFADPRLSLRLTHGYGALGGASGWASTIRHLSPTQNPPVEGPKPASQRDNTRQSPKACTGGY